MGRKVTFDEKKSIVQWTIDHDNNYKAAAEKYNVSYQRVYSWVRKYQENNDWAALRITVGVTRVKNRLMN